MSINPDELFSWRLKRAALQLRQRDVAARARISQRRYSQLERGEAVPTEGERIAIDRALELPAATARTLAAVAVGTGAEGVAT